MKSARSRCRWFQLRTAGELTSEIRWLQMHGGERKIVLALIFKWFGSEHALTYWSELGTSCPYKSIFIFKLQALTIQVHKSPFETFVRGGEKQMEARSLMLLAILLSAAVADRGACATTFDGETPTRRDVSDLHRVSTAFEITRRDFFFRGRRIGPGTVPPAPQANRAYHQAAPPSPGSIS